MELITRTIYNSYLQTCQHLDLPFRMFENSTLNAKFNVQADVAPAPNELPTVKYLAIGNGGHKLTVGANGIAKPEPLQHRATDAALYNHLPFVLREPAYDLTPAERAKYALRRDESHNGVRYIAYYLRRIDLTTVVPQMNLVTVTGNDKVVTPFVPNASNLSPTPPDLTPEGVNAVDGSYVTASALIKGLMNEEDMRELTNVANIIYGDTQYGIVSEIGLVSGVDKTIQTNSPGQAPFNFNEVICAQVCSFIATFFSVVWSNKGFNIDIDVGATEPLYKITNAPQAGA